MENQLESNKHSATDAHESLNAASVYAGERVGFLGQIWHHVANNYETVAHGKGTFLQDLELTAEVAGGAAIGAAAVGAALGVGGSVGFALYMNYAIEGAVVGEAALGGAETGAVLATGTILPPMFRYMLSNGMASPQALHVKI